MITIPGIKASSKKDGTDERSFEKFNLPIGTKKNKADGKSGSMDTQKLMDTVNKDFPEDTGNLGKQTPSAKLTF